MVQFNEWHVLFNVSMAPETEKGQRQQEINKYDDLPTELFEKILIEF